MRSATVVVRQVVDGDEKISVPAKGQASTFVLYRYLPVCFNVFSYLKIQFAVKN